MPFASEDVRAWENSEIMIEFEKVAANMDLLGDGFSEAFQPIPEKTASTEPNPSWEDEIAESRQSPHNPVLETALAAFAERQEALLDAVRGIARGLADNENIKGAYRAERAVAELEAAMRRTPVKGEG